MLESRSWWMYCVPEVCSTSRPQSAPVCCDLCLGDLDASGAFFSVLFCVFSNLVWCSAYPGLLANAVKWCTMNGADRAQEKQFSETKPDCLQAPFDIHGLLWGVLNTFLAEPPPLRNPSLGCLFLRQCHMLCKGVLVDDSSSWHFSYE